MMAIRVVVDPIMTHVIDIQHCLDANGEPVPALRRQVLRIARLIEYGGPLEVGQTRGTLVECSRRIDRRPCQALLWVSKIDAETIEACCLKCLREHILISGWALTEWAAGPMEPIGPELEPEPAPESATVN
jgi:hypothetical protein